MPTDRPALSLALSGDLTLRAAAEVRDSLLAALEESARVALDIDPEAAADLTLVQLIEAGRRSAAEAGGDITLQQPAAGGLLETLTRGGFLDTPAQRQFWLKTSETC